MTELVYVKHEPVSLKDNPDYNEKWLHDRISEDPSILGLGDLEVRAVEKKQPRAGRLDMILADPETAKRYVVEIMLGEVDESHIIRTIEYWDIERKRYPQYDHTAVIIAEKINGRFLNVIGLIGSSIPIIAIQMNALKVGNNLVLCFTKVLDEIILGTEEEEEESQPVDRAYWENEASGSSLKLVDDCLEILREIIPEVDLKYNKNYISLTVSGIGSAFIRFKPKKKFTRIEAKISDQEEWKSRLEDAGLTVLPGTGSHGRMCLQVDRKDLDHKRDLLKELFEKSFQENM